MVNFMRIGYVHVSACPVEGRGFRCDNICSHSPIFHLIYYACDL